MKCWACDGSKKIPSFNKEMNKIDFNNLIKCPICDGTGEILQTNEEWFATLSTEEKAKALHKLHWEMQNHFDYRPDEEDYVEEYCLCWLKGVHRDD